MYHPQKVPRFQIHYHASSGERPWCKNPAGNGKNGRKETRWSQLPWQKPLRSAGRWQKSLLSWVPPAQRINAPKCQRKAAELKREKEISVDSKLWICGKTSSRKSPQGYEFPNKTTVLQFWKKYGKILQRQIIPQVPPCKFFNGLSLLKSSKSRRVVAALMPAPTTSTLQIGRGPASHQNPKKSKGKAV